MNITSRPISVIEFKSVDPLANGHQHGEVLRREIKELSEIRLERMCKLSSFKRPKDAILLAEKYLPVLAEFDTDLMLELRGISEASNISLEHLVILNSYTDMRDIPDSRGDLGGCSIIYNPTPQGNILGQTWDIHASALPYVIMLKINECLVFSVSGCFGMTGMNSHGVAVCINNLSSYHGKVGIIWPALVRKLLTKKTAESAQEELLKAKISSGRHYAIADKNKFFGTEVSSTSKKLITSDANKLYIHTNHCLDQEMAKEHFIREGSNTLWRYEYLTRDAMLNSLGTEQKVFLALREVSMEPQKNQPHAVATCGTIVMNTKSQNIIACAGIASEELLKWPQTTLKI